MKMIICGALALTITTASAAETDIHSANFLLTYCKLNNEDGSPNTFNGGRCAGIAQGIVTMFQLLRPAQETGEVRLGSQGLGNVLCTDIPSGVTFGQAINVVIKYGEAHPDRTHLPFSVLTVVALHEAWPCKR